MFHYSCQSDSDPPYCDSDVCENDDRELELRVISVPNRPWRSPVLPVPTGDDPAEREAYLRQQRAMIAADRRQRKAENRRRNRLLREEAARTQRSNRRPSDDAHDYPNRSENVRPRRSHGQYNETRYIMDFKTGASRQLPSDDHHRSRDDGRNRRDHERRHQERTDDALSRLQDRKDDPHTGGSSRYESRSGNDYRSERQSRRPSGCLRDERRPAKRARVRFQNDVVAILPPAASAPGAAIPSGLGSARDQQVSPQQAVDSTVAVAPPPSAESNVLRTAYQDILANMSPTNPDQPSNVGVINVIFDIRSMPQMLQQLASVMGPTRVSSDPRGEIEGVVQQTRIEQLRDQNRRLMVLLIFCYRGICLFAECCCVCRMHSYKLGLNVRAGLFK